MTKKQLLVAVCLFLASCADGETFSQKISSSSFLPPDKARLVVFRAKNDTGWLSSIPVEVDGKSFADLPSPSYVAREVEPGEHDLSSSALLSSGSAHLHVMLEPGSVHYVEATHRKAEATDTALISAVGIESTSAEEEQKGRYRLIEIDPTVAVNELQGVDAAN